MVRNVVRNSPTHAASPG